MLIIIRISSITLIAALLSQIPPGSTIHAESNKNEIEVLLGKVFELYRAQSYFEAVPLAEEAVNKSIKTLGDTDPLYASALNNLAQLYIALGEYQKGEPLLKEALVIHEKNYDPTHHHVAVVLNNLAEVYRMTARYKEAEPLYFRAKDIWSTVWGTNHLWVARALNNLATLYSDMGDYKKAKKNYEDSLLIKNSRLPSNHPSLAITYTNLAAVYQELGEFRMAEAMFLKAKAVQEEGSPGHDVSLAITLNNLARLNEDTGRYINSERLYREALKLQKGSLGVEHPDLATTLNNLGLLLRKRAQYSNAEHYLKLALNMKRSTLHPQHPDIAISLINLCGLYRTVGDYHQAIVLSQQAIKIFEDSLGKDHPLLATAYQSLGKAYQFTENYPKALANYQKALAIRKKALGLMHPDLAQSFNDLATVYVDTGRYEDAIPLYEKARDITAQVFGSDHPEVAALLSNQGLLLARMGQLDKAETLLKRAHQIRLKVLGPQHPEVGLSFLELARVAGARKQFNIALGLFKQAFAIEDSIIQNVFSFSSEEQKLKFIDSLLGSYYGFLSLIRELPQLEKDQILWGFNRVLRRKGIVLDAESVEKERILAQLSEEARVEWDRVAVLQSERSWMLSHRSSNEQQQVIDEKLRTMTEEIITLQRKLKNQSLLNHFEDPQKDISVEKIIPKLPPQSALIEFVKVPDFNFVDGTFSDNQRYFAFTVDSSGEVMFHDLGDSQEIDRSITRFIRDVSIITSLWTQNREITFSILERCQSNLRALSQSIWIPIYRYLKRKERIIISPDSQLNRIPFIALLDEGDRPLVESVELVYVTSGRDIVRKYPKKIGRTQKTLLLVANASYDHQPKIVQFSRSVPARELRIAPSLHFSSLPGTLQEAREIPDLVADLVERKVVLLGKAATESAIRLVQSPQIVHLATHGFFLKSENDLPKAPLRYTKSLVRSGIALAGANNHENLPPTNDGLLTALEITAMDFSNTNMVVLSACETGLGVVETGEGVFGLRRAFVIAGVRNLVMSLWKIEDKSTAIQMKNFYKNLQRLSPARALREAQKETIRTLKKNFPDFVPSGLWAPFIVQGTEAFTPMNFVY